MGDFHKVQVPLASFVIIQTQKGNIANLAFLSCCYLGLPDSHQWITFQSSITVQTQHKHYIHQNTYRLHSLAKQGNNALSSVCPSVCDALLLEQFDLWPSSLLHCFKVNVRGWGQDQRSGSRWLVNVKDQGRKSGVQRSIIGAKCDCLCVCNEWAYANNCADMVNRLLIIKCVA